MKKRIISLCMAVIMIAAVFTTFANAESAPSGKPSGGASLSPYFTDEFTFDDENTRSLVHYIVAPRLQIISPQTGVIKTVISFTTSETMQKLGFSKLTIQAWRNNAWTDVFTITDVFTENGSSFYYATTQAGFVSGSYYRVKCDMVAKKNWLLVELQSITSSYITCR